MSVKGRRALSLLLDECFGENCLRHGSGEGARVLLTQTAALGAVSVVETT